MSEERKYVGKTIRALVDYPLVGNVKKGEEAKIRCNRGRYRADFPSQKDYSLGDDDEILEQYIKLGKFEIIESDDKTKYSELTVGMILPEKVITDWCSKEGNYYLQPEGWGVDNHGGFRRDRQIVEFDIKDGVECFLISNTLDVYARKEGFLDFLNGVQSPLTKEKSLKNIEEFVKEKTSDGIGDESLSEIRKELFEMVKLHNSTFDDFVDYKKFLENVW